MSLRTYGTQTNAIKYDLQAFSGRLSLGCCWGWYPWSLKIIFQSYLTNHRRSTRMVNPKSHWYHSDGLSLNHRQNKDGLSLSCRVLWRTGPEASAGTTMIGKSVTAGARLSFKIIFFVRKYLHYETVTVKKTWWYECLPSVPWAPSCSPLGYCRWAMLM